MSETTTAPEVKVKSKKMFLILACGQYDARLSLRSYKVKQVISDYEKLGQKKLKTKYFGKVKKDEKWISDLGGVWLNGYGFLIKFSDGSEYFRESTDGGRDGLYTSPHSQGGQNFQKIFKNKTPSEIFPKEFEIIGDNL